VMQDTRSVQMTNFPGSCSLSESAAWHVVKGNLCQVFTSGLQLSATVMGGPGVSGAHRALPILGRAVCWSDCAPCNLKILSWSEPSCYQGCYTMRDATSCRIPLPCPTLGTHQSGRSCLQT
jgi:hypothetical protein